MYEGLIDKSWYSAFRNALGAYRDHKRVLELSPNYADAKLVVGVYEYIVAALPLYERLAAYLFSVKGNKAEGLNYIREAADAGGEASVDAKTALALFLVREHQYPEALSLIRELYHAYPHNFHYGQSEGNALRDAGNFSQAAAVYRNLLALTQRNMFPHPHPASLAINLGRTLRVGRWYAGHGARGDLTREAAGRRDVRFASRTRHRHSQISGSDRNGSQSDRCQRGKIVPEARLSLSRAQSSQLLEYRKRCSVRAALSSLIAGARQKPSPYFAPGWFADRV
jgi:tetratricopeptide (TPR) repeat protein